MALALSLTAAAPRLSHTPPCTCPWGFGPATPSSSPPRQAYQHRSLSSAPGPGHPQEFRVTWDAGRPQPGRWCVSPRARLALLCRVTTHRRLRVRIWFTCDDLLVLGLGPAALEGCTCSGPCPSSLAPPRGQAHWWLFRGAAATPSPTTTRALHLETRPHGLSPQVQAGVRKGQAVCDTTSGSQPRLQPAGCSLCPQL